MTRQQLLSLGLGPGAVKKRALAGRLIRVHRGVYAVGHLPTNPLDRAHGALLAAGPRSALAGLSAAALWQLRTDWPRRVELIGPLRRRIPGVSSGLSATLLQRDVRTADGIRVTSPARTLLDIAPRISERELHRAHNELRMRRLIANAQLLDVASRNRMHPGAKRLAALAGASAGEPKRSVLEIDWATFAAKYELPPFEVNVHVAGHRVDVLFATEKPLIVELDGWDTHGTRRAYEADRDRDAEILAKTGIPTIRITHHALHHRPREQADRVKAILARSS